MSEYQYYEFQAMDRPLSEEEQAQIYTLSRRVELTPTQAVFTYSFGDFRGNPEEVLEKYFDAMLYLANFGTKRLMLRFPRSVMDAEAFTPYCVRHVISTSVTKAHVVLDICIQVETGGYWVEGAGWLSSLAPLRQDLLHGDFRVLYLAWLKAIEMEGILDHSQRERTHTDYVENDEIEIAYGREKPGRCDLENQLEPPVPANLGSLSAPLKKFVKLFEVDQDLLAGASRASVSEGEPSVREIKASVARLPEEERNRFLVRVAQGEPHVGVELMRRLSEISSGEAGAAASSTPRRRTVSELLAAANEHFKRRTQQEQRAAEQARLRKLEEMAKQEPQLWEQVFDLIEQKNSKAYAEAIKMVVDLRELAQHLDQKDRFQAQVKRIHNDYPNRPVFISRLQDAGLLKDEIKE